MTLTNQLCSKFGAKDHWVCVSHKLRLFYDSVLNFEGLLQEYEIVWKCCVHYFLVRLYEVLWRVAQFFEMLPHCRFDVLCFSSWIGPHLIKPICGNHLYLEGMGNASHIGMGTPKIPRNQASWCMIHRWLVLILHGYIFCCSWHDISFSVGY